MTRWLAVFSMLALAGPAAAQEFRTMQSIPTPPPVRAAGAGSSAFAPVDPKLIDSAVRGLFEARNTPRMRELLGPDFYEAVRLVDTLSTELPRDAVLRVLGIEGFSTLAQTKVKGGPGRPEALVSTVSVIVRSQLEFNDPAQGFVRRPGLNEFIFEVRGAVTR